MRLIPWRFRLTLGSITGPVDDFNTFYVPVTARWWMPGWLIGRYLDRAFKRRFYRRLSLVQGPDARGTWTATYERVRR